MTIQRKAVCRNCGTVFAYAVNKPSTRHRTACSVRCRATMGGHGTAKNHTRTRRDAAQNLTPGQVDAMLSEAVAMETAPPWVRHPVPWS